MNSNGIYHLAAASGGILYTHLIETNGFQLLDQAATPAVEHAHYPASSGKIRNQLVHMNVRVRFRKIDKY